jgi:hypothetical protein
MARLALALRWQRAKCQGVEILEVSTHVPNHHTVLSDALPTQQVPAWPCSVPAEDSKSLCDGFFAFWPCFLLALSVLRVRQIVWGIGFEYVQGVLRHVQ